MLTYGTYGKKRGNTEVGEGDSDEQSSVHPLNWAYSEKGLRATGKINDPNWH